MAWVVVLGHVVVQQYMHPSRRATVADVPSVSISVPVHDCDFLPMSPLLPPPSLPPQVQLLRRRMLESVVEVAYWVVGSKT